MATTKLTKIIVDRAGSSDVGPNGIGGAPDTFLFDTTVKGFGVRVKASGVKSYFVQYRQGAGGRKARKVRFYIGRHGQPWTVEQARKHAKALLAVDNTFTTPRLYRPFDHGADFVIHSVTKMLAGHSDVTLGYAAARDPEHARRLYDVAVTWGLTPSPFDCWLAERGLHSFDLRFGRAQANAAALADHLAGLAGVEALLGLAKRRQGFLQLFRAFAHGQAAMVCVLHCRSGAVAFQGESGRS